MQYTRARSNGESWSSSFIWGRNHKTDGHADSNAWLFETLFPVTAKDFVTGRFEIADKDEILPQAFRAKAFTGGYTRDLSSRSNLETGVGANITGYAIPDAVRRVYGDHPWGVSVYFRVRLKRG